MVYDPATFEPESMWSFLLLFFACPPAPADKPEPTDRACAEVEEQTWYPDLDSDGYGNVRAGVRSCFMPDGYVTNGDDCNDLDATVNPTTAWYVDADLDGFGAPPILSACTAPFGYVRVDGDCDDAEPASVPGATESCDGLDNDCDGLIDDDDPDIVGQRSWFPDGDGDGYGVWEGQVTTCAQPEGFAFSPNDCDDVDPEIYWGAPESCSELIDRNCDGNLAYEDLDGDGHPSCTDCDDDDPAINIDADEICSDNLDNNCDNRIDDASARDALTFYDDDDADGWGDDADPVLDCALPPNAVLLGGDCDDTDGDLHPEAAERCDGLDQDCDGVVDEDADDATSWYEDLDGDGVGALLLEVDCTTLGAAVAIGGDCDDTRAEVSPSGVELCDTEGLDEDCDGLINDDDVDPIGATAWTPDQDDDGYGAGIPVGPACEGPAGYAPRDGDCDDDDPTISPDQIEVCDGIDADCDGLDDDEDAVDIADYYPDDDGDGYGTLGRITACDLPYGYALFSGDCDDGDATRSPAIPEICNALDDDCDGQTDESDAIDASPWYDDDDLDSFGDETDPVWSCRAIAGRLDDGGDCDDADPTINILGTEVCDPLDADENCNGLSDDADPLLDPVGTVPFPVDSDGDGHGDPALTVQHCDAGLGASASTDDCDDTDSTVYPGAGERCGAADDDCDGLRDDDDPDLDPASTSPWYTDADADGYGDPTAPFWACAAPFGALADATDCDDTDRTIHPGADERCDTVDADCDGQTSDPESLDTLIWYADLDGDGAGAGVGTLLCDALSGTVASADDCDDADPLIHPDRPEDQCDGLDNDCDGTVDLGPTEAWEDLDGDGYGDPNLPVLTCGLGTSVSTNAEDCDDADPDAWPGAPDPWGDGLDQNCDGSLSLDQDEDGVLADDDCDDTDPSRHPYAFEDLTNGIDDDCDGAADTDDPDDVWELVLDDDDVVDVGFDTFFFPFCGSDWDLVSLHSDGRLLFDDADLGATPSTLALGSQRAVAPLWTDLDPSLGGTVAWQESADHVSFWWVDVPTATGTATFSLTLFDSGKARFGYGALDVGTALTGWSCAPGQGFREEDLTAAAGEGLIGTGTEEALAEVFTELDPIDLAGGWLDLRLTLR